MPVMANTIASFDPNSTRLLQQSLPPLSPAVMPPFPGLNDDQKKTLKVLSALQCTCGLSCFIASITLLAMGRHPAPGLVGLGSCCDTLFIAAGILGLITAKKNRAGLIIVTMTLSIISCASLIFPVSASAIGLDGGYDVLCRENHCYSQATRVGSFVANLLMMIFTVVEFIVAVWTSVVCSRGVCSYCCGRFSFLYSPRRVILIGQANGQQVIVYPRSGRFNGHEVLTLTEQQGHLTGYMLLPQPLPPNSVPPTSTSELQGTLPPAYEVAQSNPLYASGGGDFSKHPLPV